MSDQELCGNQNQTAEDHDASANTVCGAPGFCIVERPWRANADKIVRPEVREVISHYDEEDEDAVECVAIHSDAAAKRCGRLQAKHSEHEYEHRTPNDARCRERAVVFAAG